ncbi:MAG: hypothetical protein K0U42_09015 [Actinomycetia bacterium]|nr:hypothetical protein [Actinomycetes bacterium]
MSNLPDQTLIRSAARKLAISGAQEISVITELRSQGHDPELVRMAIEQAQLRLKAANAWGPSGSSREKWFFTRDGLEQASHPLVAQLHADVIAQGDFTQVVDLTAGLGSDSAAFIEAGLGTTSVEQEVRTAKLLAANLPNAQVIVGDCTEFDEHKWEPETTAIFVDPARRTGTRSPDGSRALPERDPQRWSPPLTFVTDLADTFSVFMKAAPAFTPPEGWASFIVSLDGSLIEIFTTNAARGTYAVMIDSHNESAHVIAREEETEHSIFSAPKARGENLLDEGKGFLYELDPAITRAELSLQVADELGLTPVGEKGLWLYGLESLSMNGARSYQIHDTFDVKDIKARTHHTPGIALKTKDGRREIKDLRKECGKPDHNEWAVVILGSGSSEKAVLVRRAS